MSRVVGAVLSYLVGYFFMVGVVVLGISLVGAGLHYFGTPEYVVTMGMSIAIGAIIFHFAIRIIAQLPMMLKDSAWCSAIGHVYPAVASFILGFFMSEHLGVALLISMVIGIWFQQLTFRLMVRSKNGNLSKGKGYALAVIMTLSDFLISSPIVWLILRWVPQRGS